MDSSMTELTTIGNLWVRHLEEKGVVHPAWQLRMLVKDNKIVYTSKRVSVVLLEGLMEEHMLTYIHYLTLNI